MMNDKMHRLRQGGFFFAVILLCSVGIFLHLSVIFNARQLLAGLEGHVPKISAAVVSSGSMSPTLEVGDLVVIVPSETYQPGDIVEIAGKDGTRILHRLIIFNTFADIALTKGDANAMADDSIRCSEIQGKLWLRLPYVGTAVNFCKSVVSHPILLLILLSLLLFLSILKSVLRRKTDSECRFLPILSSDVESVGDQNHRKGRIKILGILTVVLLLLMTAVFSCSRISALWHSGCSGTFLLQAGSSAAEEGIEGIDVVYWQLD